MIGLIENRPMLRVLKLASKLHKAGLTADETVRFVINCRDDLNETVRFVSNCRDDLNRAITMCGLDERLRGWFPSAAHDPKTILSASFIWEGTPEGHDYWAAIARRIAA